MVLNYYSKRDPPDLSEFLMWVTVASKINVFLVLSHMNHHIIYLCQTRAQSDQ